MRHLAIAASVLTLASLFPPGVATAVTRAVPSPYATIQSAINASTYGDVVSVAAGTFKENVIMRNGITLKGAGIDATILDGRAITSGIYVPGGASALTRILDLTVRNGRAGQGGGIKADDGNDCEIRRVAVRENVATSRGGGIYVGQNSATTIAECVIYGNKAGLGGGIYLQSSQSLVEYSLICNNAATVAGGAIFAALDRSGIIWDTIDGNSSPGGGAGLASSLSAVRVHTTIFSNNGGGFGLWTNSPILEKCNDFWANGLGGISGQSPSATDRFLDPLFCDSPSHDLHLNLTSPCVLGTCEKQVGALGPGCGIAAPTSTENTTWGELKSLFR